MAIETVEGMQRPKKYFGAYKEPLTTLPNLVEPQVHPFKWLF